MPEKYFKLEALREQGTLNRRPGEVTEPPFAADSFFDSIDLAQVKYEMLRRVQSEGYSAAGAATALGFPGPLFIRRSRPLEEGGLGGRGPQTRSEAGVQTDR